jgi:hypothetical protein
MSRMRTSTLNRVGILSVAKMMGILYGCIGFLVGGLFTLMALLGSALGSQMEGGAEAALGGALVGVLAIVILPIIYGGMGFIGGAITAALYNVVAGWVGGVELELSE